jgi:hypothetical protein
MEAVGSYRPSQCWSGIVAVLVVSHLLTTTMATKAKSDVKVLKGQDGKI